MKAFFSLITVLSFFLISCGASEATMKELGAKVDGFNTKAIAYNDCLIKDPAGCVGEFEKLEAEMNAISKEISEKVPAESDWKTNDHYQTMLRKIWGDIRLSNTSAKKP